MRIIGGTCRGRPLTSPTWTGLRPTSDRLRETIFDILGPEVDGATVLDVCAGTGAIALEALSRGAVAATCLESDPRARALIRANAQRCGLGSRCMIVPGDAPGALTERSIGGPFDVIVLDPPYDAPWLARAVAAAAALLAPGGRMVLEHGARVPAPEITGLRLERTRRAGDSALTTYRAAGAAAGGAEQ